jgi:hypothetical protein
VTREMSDTYHYYGYYGYYGKNYYKSYTGSDK